MHVEHVDSEFYRTRLQIALGMASSSTRAALAEAGHILEMLLSEAGPGLQLADLERDFREARDLDLGSIEAAVTALRAMNLKPVPLPNQKNIDPQRAFGRIEQALRQLSRQHLLATNQAWFQLEFQVDGDLNNLLICAAFAGADMSKLVTLAEGKLAVLSGVTLVQVWSRIQREFDEDRGIPHLNAASSVLPPKFLDLEEGDELRTKIARYVIEFKPKLVVERINGGSFSYPLDAVGPARLLSVNTTSPPLERDVLRLDLARGIGRIAAVWQTLLKRKLADLAALLRLVPETKLLQGADVKAAQAELQDAETPAAAAVHEVNAFLSTLERLGAARAGVEDLLRRHKLGLEVTLPESAKEVAGRSELLLQKTLCRFLLEQGVYAEGTKFGPFETDLLASVRAMATVIEVKLYSRNKRPTVKTLRANLAQLQDYMDKRPVRPTGALVVYNLSPTLVVAPNRWVRGRYWICVVNLGKPTGSARRSTLTLDETQGDQLIVGMLNDADSSTGVPRPKRAISKKPPHKKPRP
jgi:hypothetical protein